MNSDVLTAEIDDTITMDDTNNITTISSPVIELSLTEELEKQVTEPTSDGRPENMVKDTNDMLHMVQESTLQDAEKRVSFATVVVTENTHKKVNFRKVEEDVASNVDYESMIPMSFVVKVNERLSNTIYGYFIGKRVAFPVVENYVYNAWGKFGIQKVMMYAKGFYFFKFSSTKGVDDVLENGPWMIRQVPIILNTWSPSTSLTKDNHSSVPIILSFFQVVFRCASGLVGTETSCDKSPKNKGQASGSEGSNIDQYDPLFLHSNDSSGVPLINFKLEDVFMGQVFSKNAKVVWDELEETYSKQDASDESHRSNQSYNVSKTSNGNTAFMARTNLRNNNWSGSSNQPRKLNRPNLVCTHCNMNGHTADRCFELVGYPPNFKRNTSTNRGSTSNNDVELRISLLLNMIVGHPIGTKALVTHVGNLKLTDKIVIHDVLVVPGYQDSVLKTQVETGPYKVQSREGYKYFLTLVDDYTSDLEEDLSNEPCDDRRDSRSEGGKGTHQLSQGGTKNTAYQQKQTIIA
ncbi:polyadenylate-binding protein 2-like protein [Tanacetum coccineum]